MSASPPETAAKQELHAVLRKDGGKLLSILIATLRSFERAEDALQEAGLSALKHWSGVGVPANPAAWLLQVARRKAIDSLRREKTRKDRALDVGYLMALDQKHSAASEGSEIPDERLKLIFTCCHPALDKQASVALTLRTVCGLSTGQIARAFLVTRETMAQRLVRAQQKISKAGIPFAVPEPHQFSERLDAVLNVIYLIFNAGYTDVQHLKERQNLCAEAIHLVEIVVALVPDEPEAQGLLALMQLHQARFRTRCDEEGIPLGLDEQDRRQWDKPLIVSAVSKLLQALQTGRPGPFQMQAAISAIHCEAECFKATNWREIVGIYDRMLQLSSNPVVALNRLVALSYLEGPESALSELARLTPDLGSYQPYHAARADLLVRAGQYVESAQAYKMAMRMSHTDEEKAFLARRLRKLRMA